MSFKYLLKLLRPFLFLAVFLQQGVLAWAGGGSMTAVPEDFPVSFSSFSDDVSAVKGAVSWLFSGGPVRSITVIRGKYADGVINQSDQKAGMSREASVTAAQE